ncbi:protease serine 54 [Cricetulus griseus]
MLASIFYVEDLLGRTKQQGGRAPSKTEPAEQESQGLGKWQRPQGASFLPHSEAYAPSAVCGSQKAIIVDDSKENLVGSNEFPWVVSLQDPEYTHLAFGCILSEFWILSTASALQHRLVLPGKKVIAVVGIANMDPRKIDHTEYPVNTIILHENFNNKSMSNNIALGEPGSPLMCQVKKLDLWVLRGILTHGGDLCPGLLLYANVEDYSDWIIAKTRRAGPFLSALNPWEKLVPEFQFDESNIALTKSVYSVHSHAEWPRSYSQGSKMSSLYDMSTDDGKNFRVNGLQEAGWPSKVAVQPMYYDYYGGEAGEDGAMAGQNRLHWPQEIILMSLVLVFLGSGV